MKVLGLALTLALVAVALMAAPYGQSSAGGVVIAGIDGSGGPQAVCDHTDGLWTGRCPIPDSKRMVVAGIDGGGRA